MNNSAQKMIRTGVSLFVTFMALTISQRLGAADHIAMGSLGNASTTGAPSSEERFEPLTQAQVEILVDGRNLDKDYRRYQKRKHQYPSFVDFEYEMSVRRYHSGKKKFRLGIALMVTSVIPIGLGVALLCLDNMGSPVGEADNDEDDDSGDFSGMATLLGGGVALAGTGLLITGAIFAAKGSFMKRVWGKAADRIHPYADYYQRYPKRPVTFAGAGFFATGTSVAAGASFTF